MKTSSKDFKSYNAPRILLGIVLACGAATTAPAHPLDPLTADEIRTAVRLMRGDARLAHAAIPRVTLNEPPKADVLAADARSLPREARALATAGRSVFEVVIDLSGRRLKSVVERQDVEAPITLSEIESVKSVLDNAEFRAGLRRRGIADTAKLFCAPFSAGYFGAAAEEGKRLVKVGCFDTSRSTTNVFGWPIERLYALVDLRSHQVLSVTDGGAVPVAPGNRNYDAAAIDALRAPQHPTTIAQPQGNNIGIDGHEVSWGNWRFHARLDGRVGTVISVARWMDRGRPRSILYQGYLSEMFVPYMDDDYGWYSRTYFDTGEYGAGVLASSLQPGVDCPAAATFLPAVFNDDEGEPFTTPNAMCLFERAAGDPIWRHAEAVNQTREGRANVELVVRMAASIGNYDYLFDWVFDDAAEIEVRVGATGIDALKGVVTARMADASAAADTRTGTLVAPNLVAVNHDHYFNLRLDLDIDGPVNSFVEDVYRPVSLAPGYPRRSMYVVEPHAAADERAGMLDTAHGPAKYRVVNDSTTNAVGNAASYEVMFANHARLLLDPDDWPARRAAFLRHDLWVTPYDPAERYASGEYVFESRGTDGLAAWTARDRPIRGRDIVVWVNLGMHHLTRAEDLPVMPTIWHSFRLRPHNFFDRNPALDLPPNVR